MTEPLDRATPNESQIFDPRDLDYVKTLTDPARREVVVCSIVTHRRPDTLAVGDPVPPLDLTYLEDAAAMQRVNLASVSEQPLVLIFGSYT